jgi:hypothetical protein
MCKATEKEAANCQLPQPQGPRSHAFTETIPPQHRFTSRCDSEFQEHSRAQDKGKEPYTCWFGGASPGENKQNWRASHTVYSSAQLQEAKFAAGVYTSPSPTERSGVSRISTTPCKAPGANIHAVSRHATPSGRTRTPSPPAQPATARRRGFQIGKRRRAAGFRRPLLHCFTCPRTSDHGKRLREHGRLSKRTILTLVARSVSASASLVAV